MSSAMTIAPGAPAPWFTAPTPSRPDFSFSSLGGRYVLMAFLPEDATRREAAIQLLRANIDAFDDVNVCVFGVLRDAAAIAAARDERRGLRWFFDPAGDIAQAFGAGPRDGPAPALWVLLDPMLRVMAFAPLEQGEAMLRHVRALPPPDGHAGTSVWAPVLVLPRVFEPDVCRRLIAHYDAVGGQVSGVMREIDGKTVPVVDNFKRRRDADVTDEAFKAELRHRIVRRVLPEIEKAFQFKVSRMERYIVARYGADEGGWFRAHRDNTTLGTAHRKFACSINLNAEEFEGGDLRFPEFGSRTYRPPTGGAVVFSCSLLHEATPVTRGARYAFLPFFYDEAGARVRQANQHALVTNPPAPETAPTEAS